MRSSAIIATAISAFIFLSADAGQAVADPGTPGRTNSLTDLPGIVNAIPGASNWIQTNLPSGAAKFLQNLTNHYGTNRLTSPSNLFPALSNWLSTNSAHGGTNSMSQISKWFGTNVSANVTNTFQNFTNWLGTNYSRTLTNLSTNTLTPGLSNVTSTNLPPNLTDDSRLSQSRILSTDSPSSPG
jgi:hypothetical protein